VIHLEAVEKRYGRFQAVQPLNLHVRPGEVFGFLGPNGAGKTTTIRMMAGVLVPSAGRLLIDGIDIVKEPIESKRRVGYIPDRPYLYDKLTAREFLEFIGGMYQLPRALVRERGDALLADNGLLPRADELIEGLLIVDEPMVGLDPKGARQIKDRFRAIADSGRTVFLSTHSMATAQEVCDRIGILFRGKLVALGTVSELLSGTNSADLEQVFLQLTEEDAATADPRLGTP